MLYEVITVFDDLRKQVRALPDHDRIRVNKSGCMAQCGFGPMVVVHPEDVWYAGVRVADVLSGPPAEHHQIQQAVGAQAVGPVDRDAGAFP